MRLHRLKALDIARTHLKPGMHADGGGLYLRVAPGGSRQWIFRYRRSGKLFDMGLGGASAITLAEARKKAADQRKLLAEGKEPLAEKRAIAKLRFGSRSISFAEAARRCIEARKAGWRNHKHAAQWLSTLETYVSPAMGDVPVADVEVGHVLSVLEPIWAAKTETASRVRQRIEAVLDWAKVRGYRRGDNPARWKGHLAEVLPARAKVQRVRHHRALHYDGMPSFMDSLRAQKGMAALALEFAILTGARTGEVTGASWAEVDFDGAMWSVPGERVKSGRDHRVPLSGRALQILRELPHRDGVLFPGPNPGRGLSSNAFLALMKRMGVSAFVPHGFRSSLRDWAAEQTNYPREVAEAALAHAIGDKVEAAYRRSDLFAKRRLMMEDWAKHCDRIESSNTKSQALSRAPAAS